MKHLTHQRLLVFAGLVSLFLFCGCKEDRKEQLRMVTEATFPPL